MGATLSPLSQDVAGQCPALAKTTAPSLQTMIGLCTVVVN
jgi:hypothetical protein